jgi:kynurenine 3-monooxygenase
MKQTVHVVGSGLVGSLVALFLGQEGFQVELYERRADMRKADMSAGRSINLVITDRGLKAVEKVGLKEKILDLTIAMKGRMLHDINGETTFVPYGQNENEVIHSISRGLLNCLLMDCVDECPDINIHFEHRCSGYDLNESVLSFDNGEQVSADVTIGADGSFSAIRKAMLEGVPNFNYSQDFLEHGYKELTIPAMPNGDHAMGKEYLHIWPRENYMLIALPNLDGSFTCTLFYPYEGEESFQSIETEDDVIELFERVFPDALPLMPTLVEDYFNNPTGSLVTVRCQPWFVGGQVVLLGDAAHAIVPFFGQGMNSGFEDCRVLGELVSQHKAGQDTDWQTIFKDFHQARKVNADAIADLALENFVEMRDKTADPLFQLKKKVGFELEKRYPDLFIPRYSMVMFHPEISYSEALQRSLVQGRLLEKLCSDIDSSGEIDWDGVDSLIRELLGSGVTDL